MGILTSKKLWAFVGGIAAGLALKPIVTSKCVRKAAVGVVAKGMEMKDGAKSACEQIKEDAQDVYAEAKSKARNGDGPDTEEE